LRLRSRPVTGIDGAPHPVGALRRDHRELPTIVSALHRTRHLRMRRYSLVVSQPLHAG